MKKLFTKLTAIALLFSCTISCSKDEDPQNNIQIAPPNASSFMHLRNQALANITQSVTFKAEDGLHFVSEKGAVLDIGAGDLFDDQWSTVLGDVTLSFIEIYDRGNMVATNKALMGRNSNGDLLPLITGGQFFVEVRQGDQVLRPGGHYNLSVKAAHTGGLDNDMLLWQGEINAFGNLVWEEVDTDIDQGGEIDEEGNPIGGGIGVAGFDTNTASNTYDFFLNNFGWANVDRFAIDPRPKTKIKVVVPEAYNATNAAVYLAYEDTPGLLAQLDIYQGAEKLFTEHYGFVPIGITLHVIFVTESNGAYAFAIKQATINEDDVITILDDDLQISTEENLVAQINALN